MEGMDEFKEAMNETTKALAESIAQENQRDQLLLSKEVNQKKTETELNQEIEACQNRLHDGLKWCILALIHCDELPLSAVEVVSELQKCFLVIKNPQDLAGFGKNIFLGISWKEQLGISDACMQSLYQGGRFLFEFKDYIQAENAFFAICSIDPSQFAYWIGLGHSNFQNKHYQQAVNAYIMASGLEPVNAWPHIWAANCFEAEKDYKFACMALGDAIALLQSITPKNTDLLQLLEARLKKNQKH